jgi:hypothetical protein
MNSWLGSFYFSFILCEIKLCSFSKCMEEHIDDYAWVQLKEIWNYDLMGWYINKLWECFWPLKIHNMKDFLEEMFFAIQEKA